MSEPFWTDAVFEDTERDTSDPLGLQTCARRVAELLVPGFSQGTSRARDLALWVAGVWLSEDSKLDQEVFLGRYERLLMLAAMYHNGDEGQLEHLGMPKNVMAKAILRKAGRTSMSLDKKLFANTAHGHFFAFRNLARAAGLVEIQADEKRQERVTTLGQLVAKAALQSQASKVLAAVERGQVAKAGLSALALDRACSTTERRGIREGLFGIVGEGECGIEALWSKVHWSKAHKLRVDRRLPGRPKLLLDAADALKALLEEVEDHYRDALAYHTSKSIRANARATMDLDLVIKATGLDTWSMRSLRRCLHEGKGDFAPLHLHQQRLARARGRTPWEVGDVMLVRGKRRLLAPYGRLAALAQMISDVEGVA